MRRLVSVHALLLTDTTPSSETELVGLNWTTKHKVLTIEMKTPRSVN